ncbi:AEC family transporter [Glutamicibacter sp. JL.03c]|uniref:AEC family transporter n=1 Tax=Glutamicibacter sp. JL.03c TaxID=2984842 RepID=UPI0021F6C9B1|nr:AEC family transporter [Glutamicibacter sp. JL.03c]UYQ76999.1 AEC family transporter [Glutamicibacter sp. JL.03c]
MYGVIEGFFGIWVIIGVGYWAGKKNLFGDNGRYILNRLTFFIASPTLLFTTISAAKPHEALGPQLFIAGIAAMAVFLAYWVFSRLAFKRSAGERTIGSMAASTVNAGNLGLPIAIYALGDISLAAPIALFQMSVMTPLSLALMEKATAKGGTKFAGVLWRTISNPMIIASVLGLLCSIYQWRPPQIIMTPIELLAGASIPAMLLGFGLSLVGSRPLQRSSGRRAEVWVASFSKLVVHPLLAWALAAWVFRLDSTGQYIAVIMAALPTAQNIFVNADRYGSGVTIAKDTVLLTTVLGIPAMLGFAALLLHVG